jgi:hypothetical protein
MEYFVYALAAASLALNAYLYFWRKDQSQVLSIDAKRLLSDLTNGKAIVEVRVLDTSALFLRSPRG